MSGLLSSCEGHLGILLVAWQGNRDDSQGEAGDPGSLSSCHRDIGIPINYQEESGLVTFCSSELCVPLRFQRDVRPPVEMRQGPRAFSLFSKEDSDIPSSGEMRD